MCDVDVCDNMNRKSFFWRTLCLATLTHTRWLSIFGYQQIYSFGYHAQCAPDYPTIRVTYSELSRILCKFGIFFPFFHSFVAKTLRYNGPKSDLDLYHRIHMCVCITVNWILLFFWSNVQISTLWMIELLQKTRTTRTRCM